MAEETEAVRVDRAKRDIEQRERMSWAGKKVVLPRGTSLPSTGESGEVFVLIKNAAIDQMYIFDESQNNWVTVGPG